MFLGNLNYKFIFSLSVLLIFCSNNNIKFYFPIYIILLFLFLPYPILKKKLNFLFRYFYPIVILIFFNLILILIFFFLIKDFNFLFSLRAPFYLLSIILISIYFYFWFIDLKDSLNKNLFLSLIISELFAIIFFDKLLFTQNVNFTLFNLISFYLIISLTYQHKKNYLFFFFITFYFILGFYFKSQQSLLLFIGSITIYFFININNVKIFVYSLEKLTYLFPLLLFLFFNLFPQITKLDSNVAFRYDALVYNISRIAENPINAFRTDLPVHPYFSDQDMLTDNSERNVSAHNAIIDMLSRCSIIGVFCFLLFIRKIFNTINQNNFRLLNDYVSVYLGLYLFIHLSLNQILKFNQLIIISFITGFLLYKCIDQD